MFDVGEKHHARLVISLSVTARILTSLLIYLGSAASIPFDSSHLTLELINTAPLLRKWASFAVRWDTFHFTRIAQNGYVYEYEYAFMPGTPAVMRLIAFIARALGVVQWDDPPSQMELSMCGFIASILLDPAWPLYQLTKLHTGSAQFALLTCAVSVIATSPATWLIGSYSEPFYTFFALRGLIFLSTHRYFMASVAFAFATLFRANGMLLSGFIAWSLVVAPFLRSHSVVRTPLNLRAKPLSILYAFILIGICISPLLLHQLHGYRQFCVPATHEPPREWCDRAIPAIYSFVQAHYWNVGFLKYWRVDQIPNFLLASPPLFLLIYSAATTIRASLPHVVHGTMSVPRKAVTDKTDAINPRDIEILPHALHALVMALILIFASHTQIALRVVPTLPFMHWSVAGLFIQKPGPAKVWWMHWCVIWWAVSCVLWGAFLPPA